MCTPASDDEESHKADHRFVPKPHQVFASLSAPSRSFTFANGGVGDIGRVRLRGARTAAHYGR
jgi:hypothetical protein